jgi:cation diffusion facilitator family transporter
MSLHLVDLEPERARRERDGGRVTRWAATVSLLVGLVMLAIKWSAYVLTGSRAIFADALESIVHTAATGFALLSVVLSARPPDQRFPYGYGKIAYFSAGFEGGLISITSLVIIYEGTEGLFHPRESRSLGSGLALIALATVINLVLGIWLVKLGKASQSLVLRADGEHVLADAWTSLAVVGGLVAVWMTRWIWLDSIIALVVAANILRIGYQLVREAFQGLMNQAEPELLATIVAALHSERDSSWVDMHQLRAWRAGHRTHVDFHLVVPADWTVLRLHDSLERARARLRAAVGPATEVVIHFDPDSPDLTDAEPGAWTVSHATRRPRRESSVSGEPNGSKPP